VSLCANACADRSGTCGIPVHHALRASTAAPGYFETCVLDERPGERFQGDETVANTQHRRVGVDRFVAVLVCVLVCVDGATTQARVEVRLHVRSLKAFVDW
jgi:hypothetical protein